MAYADGELDAQTCREIETTLPLDAVLAQRIARQRALQGSLRATVAPALDDLVPQRLLDAARGRPILEQPAADAECTAGPRQLSRPRAIWTWQMSTLVAVLALVAGVFAGRLLGSRAAPMLTTQAG